MPYNQYELSHRKKYRHFNWRVRQHSSIRRLATKLLIQKKMLRADKKTTFKFKDYLWNHSTSITLLIYKKVLWENSKNISSWIYKNSNHWLNFSWNLFYISVLFTLLHHTVQTLLPEEERHLTFTASNFCTWQVLEEVPHIHYFQLIQGWRVNGRVRNQFQEYRKNYRLSSCIM